MSSFKTAIWELTPGSGEAGRRVWSFGESWGSGRCKARSINQRGEENLTVCVGLTKAFADTSLQLLEGHARQVLPSK